MSGWRLRAPAKLNLVLRVTGRRADGYHLLTTLFHAVDLCDELTARSVPEGDGPTLALSAGDRRDALPASDDNLVLRAARLFGEAVGTVQRVRFDLHKRIPHGAGLGGGSSDAAAALRLCNLLTPEPLDAAALHALACRLGADVAFFLQGGSRWGQGVGDELSCAGDIAARDFVLLVPPFGCDTTAVYKNHSVDWKPPTPPSNLSDFQKRPYEDSVVNNGFVDDIEANDLTAAAERLQPDLQRLRERASGYLSSPSTPGPVARQHMVHMTGSGSTLFVSTRDASEAQWIVGQWESLVEEGCRVLAVRSLPDLPDPEPVNGPG